MKYVACIQTTQYSHSVRSDEFHRLEDALYRNFERDGEANGDQDGKLSLNYYLAKGMAGFYRDEDVLATVLIRMYEGDYRREQILDLLSVVGPKMQDWKHLLVRKGLVDSNVSVRVNALRCINMWDAQDQYDGFVRLLLETEANRFVIEMAQQTLDRTW